MITRGVLKNVLRGSVRLNSVQIRSISQVKKNIVFTHNNNDNSNVNKLLLTLQRQYSIKSESANKGKIQVEENETLDNDNDNEEGDEYYVDVSNLETRWNSLTYESQQDIISYLNVKQEFGWNYLNKEEKKAIYFIAYGNWGPRDSSIMSGAEFAFKLMTSMLLFSVLGFSMLNYAIDIEKKEQIEKDSN